MIYRGKKIPFPAITQISFSRLMDFYELQLNDPDKHVADFAKNTLEYCSQYPELRDGIEYEEFDANHPGVQKLCRSLFPEALHNNEIKGVVPPFHFKPFYRSRRLSSIMESSKEKVSFELNNYSDNELYIYGCAAILNIYYKYSFPSGMPSVVNITDKNQGTIRTYRLAMNGDLFDIIPTEKSLPVTKEDYLYLLDNFDNIDAWKQKFPPDSWIMRGIGLVNMMDVTTDQSLSSITADLLINSGDSFERIPEGLRNLFGIPHLKIGFLLYEDGAFFAPYKNGLQNFILSGHKKLSPKSNFCNHSYDLIINQKKPLIIPDVDRFDKESCSNISRTLHNQPIGSYILAPIIRDDKFLGFLELASKEKHDLTAAAFQKLDSLMPILSMALSRIHNEEQNRREAIIQQECTTIHASVKWRFEEEANKFMARQARDKQAGFEDIIFKNVYPLFGQMDIKGSSEKRNSAVKADITKQLLLAEEILNEGWQQYKLPVYEERIHRLKAFRKELAIDFFSGSEYKMTYLMQNDIHPVLEQLKKSGGLLKKKIENYFFLLHPEMFTIYDKRQQYDTSVNTINRVLAAYLDEKQDEAQQMFPHYFERYKTDGVEYNMYIGQSISKVEEFDILFLHNLQLWQFITNCEMEYRFRDIKKELKTDVEIASLILVYSTPLSIQFRMDEKRFDVDGAYNARYEIVKKRIDKSHIKGTRERITVPGKIAIIYTSDQDAVIYRHYIGFLESNGYLIENSLENLYIEDLQGITGLRALRVSINYDRKAKETPVFDVQKILEGIQNN